MAICPAPRFASIARVSLPYFGLMLLATALIVVFPGVATWFPLWVIGK